MGWFDNFISFIPIVGSIYSAVTASNQRKSDARKAERASQEANAKSYAYDVEAWDLNAKQIDANYNYQLNKATATADYHDRVAAAQDKLADQKYKEQLQIRQLQQQTNDAEFGASEALYEAQIGFNKLSGQAAEEAEWNRFQEVRYDSIMKSQDTIIDSILATGATKLKGDDRNRRKLAQSLLYQAGQDEQVLYDSLLSGKKATRDALRQIGLDKLGADIRAQAERTLQPGEIPAPFEPIKAIKPLSLPPRKIEDFDFGPYPVEGVAAYAPKGPGLVSSTVGALSGIKADQWTAMADAWKDMTKK